MIDYPDDLDVRPLTTWPGVMTKEHLRTRSQFSAPLRSTIRQLLTELGAIRGVALMEVALTPDQFRIDGRPRANVRPTHPGVVLTITRSNVGPIRFAVDKYLTWEENLRAIVLGMEALRAVDRYGITRRAEQYTGFKAIGAGESGPDLSTRVGCLAWLTAAAEWSHPLIEDPSAVEAAYRAAAKKLHPDAEGGSTVMFQQLEQAMRTLRSTS